MSYGNFNFSPYLDFKKLGYENYAGLSQANREALVLERLQNKTAVRLPEGNSGYLINPTREFVTTGGARAPTGTVIFELGNKGEWIPHRRF